MKEPSEIAEHICETIIARNSTMLIFCREENIDGSISTLYTDQIQRIYNEIIKYLENEQNS